MTKTRILAPVLGVSLLVGIAVVGQPPKRNINAGRHPNLAAAQNLSQKAYERIVEAQKANEYDMAGHAQKAKELLEQANNELRQAASAANRNAK